MSTTKQIVDQYYVLLKARDRKNLLKLLCDDIVINYHSQSDQFPWSGKFIGIDGFDRFFSLIKANLNIIEVSIVDTVVDGNKLVNICEGKWEYINSGYVVHGSMVNLFTVSNGKISGYDVFADTAAFAAGI